MKIYTWPNFSVSDHTNPTRSRKIGIVSFIKFFVENINKIKKGILIFIFYILYLYIYIIFHLQKAVAAAIAAAAAAAIATATAAAAAGVQKRILE